MSNRSIPFIVVLVAFLSLNTSAAITTPAGLTNGDSFHLVFASSGGTNATSTDITTYDAFLQNLANIAGLGTYNGQAVTWQILGSTATVSAISRFNPTAPVYRMDGELVANDGADLWDGSIANPINIDQLGNPAGSVAFTGTTSAGVQSTYFGGSNVLGAATGVTQTGLVSATDSTWVSLSFGNLNGAPARFYAVSSELVVPEPTSLALLCLGGLMAARRRR